MLSGNCLERRGVEDLSHRRGILWGITKAAIADGPLSLPEDLQGSFLR